MSGYNADKALKDGDDELEPEEVAEPPQPVAVDPWWSGAPEEVDPWR